MKIVERVRPGAIIEIHPHIVTHHQDEVDALKSQIIRLRERNLMAFDQGFAAAVQMIEHGATLSQLRAASGVVSDEWADTAVMEAVAEDTHRIELPEDP